ncbi:protein CMSS1 isoform X2 [Heterodontus francisci]|uniref:protein CMSS1 isoform X2 n=1 Tax=Heterodontus francisci TaxID=7792 RepID=UPI00355B2794
MQMHDVGVAGKASICCPSVIAPELSGLLGHFRGQLRVNHIAVGLEPHVGQTRIDHHTHQCGRKQVRSLRQYQLNLHSAAGRTPPPVPFKEINSFQDLEARGLFAEIASANLKKNNLKKTVDTPKEMSEDPPQHNIKRKRKKGDETAQPAMVKKSKKQTECFRDIKVEEIPEASPPKKKRRRKKISDVLLSSATKPAAPADLQNVIVQHFKSERSVIELQELKLPDSCFLQSNDLTHTLSSYLKQVCPKWVKLCRNHTENKSVLMLIICSSALRALEMIRLMTAFKGDCKTLKLFAKHIKIEEQIKWLAKGVIHLGVGTPGRIRNLIERDGLSLQSLKYVILDWNWRDQKLRRLMDIPEVKQETLKLLETSVIPACKSGSVKLGIF